jgi:AcrR family transcriptional regulator
VAEAKLGLRERKKRRTRETIVRVALELFASRGFQATTLTEIAEAAEIGSATLHAYFPSKVDIVFDSHDAVIESAKHRILARATNESLLEALEDWFSAELPQTLGSDTDLVRCRRVAIEHDETLQAQERLRSAFLEDVFAEAFAREFSETAEDMRSRLMAATVVSGMRTIWSWWYSHLGEDGADAHRPFELDATYLTKLVEAAETAIRHVPGPSR